MGDPEQVANTVDAPVRLPGITTLEDLIDADDAEFVLDAFNDDDGLFESFRKLIQDMDVACKQVRLYAEACPHKARAAIDRHNETIRRLMDAEAKKSAVWNRCDCGRWCMDDDPEEIMCQICHNKVEEILDRQANPSRSQREPAPGETLGSRRC